MQFSAFGEKFTQHSGILQLMDDLGDALKSDKPVNMLGGGTPARIAEVNAVFADVFSKLPPVFSDGLKVVPWPPCALSDGLGVAVLPPVFSDGLGEAGSCTF